jgi:hypothetical protein
LVNSPLVEPVLERKDRPAAPKLVSLFAELPKVRVEALV